LMVGRAVELTTQKEAAHPGEAKLTVRNLTLVNKEGTVLLDNVNFKIHAGEVLAVAGVQGNGQTELTESLIGLRHGAKGSVRLEGEELLGRSVKDLIGMGIGYVPED